MSLLVNIDVPDLESGIVWGKIAVPADPFGHGLCLIEFQNRGYGEIAGR